MLKFIIPTIIIFLIILFWDKINETINKKYNIKINRISIAIIILTFCTITTLLYFQFFMKNFDFLDYEFVESDDFFILKNVNTTIGFVRFSENGEIEYIFVNPIFRKKGVAKKLLKLVKNKTGKNLLMQEPISPLGAKLLESIQKST